MLVNSRIELIFRRQMGSLSNSTDLFSGNACFSPRVPPAVQKEWVQHGGNVANIQVDKTCATYVFCDGEDDPWFARLFQRSMAVFHWGWISAVVAAQFRLPISAYVLDGQGHSSVPGKPAHISQDEDADRTLLSTPPRDGDAHAHTLSPSARSKSEPVAARDCPEIDLRAISRSRQASTNHHRKFVPLGDRLDVDGLPEERTLVHHHEDHTSDAFRRLSSSSRAISISDALEALQHVSTANAAQFTPGTIHLGKEFRCWYA